MGCGARRAPAIRIQLDQFGSEGATAVARDGELVSAESSNPVSIEVDGGETRGGAGGGKVGRRCVRRRARDREGERERR